MEWTYAMVLMILSAFLSAISIFYCSGPSGSEVKPAKECKVNGSLVVGIMGDIAAGLGFWVLVSFGLPNSCTNYNPSLTILSLLSTGVITGNFVFRQVSVQLRGAKTNKTCCS